MVKPRNSVDARALLANTDWMRALAFQLVYDDAQADDLVQEALLIAVRTPPVAGMRSPRAWLATVVRNLARRRFRERVRRSRLEERVARREAAASDSASDVVDRAELHQFITRAVLELEEPYRTTVLLRYFDGLTPSEIAAEQQVPASTVRVRLKRALEQLRTRFDGEHGADRQAWSALLVATLQLESLRAALVAGAGSASSAATLAAVLGGIFMSIQKTSMLALLVLGLAAIGVVTFIATRPGRERTEIGGPLAGARDAVTEPDRITSGIAPPSESPPAVTVSPSRGSGVAAAPPRGDTVRGRVVDTGRVPVGRGTVTTLVAVHRDGTKTWQWSRASDAVPLDAEGRFTVSLKDAPLIVVAQVPGKQLAASDVVESGAAQDSEIEIVVHPGDTLRGMVADPDGRGIAGVTVQRFETPTAPGAASDDYVPPSLGQVTTTAPSGFFSMDGTSDRPALFDVQHPEYVQLREVLRHDGAPTEPMKITLRPGQSLTGRLAVRGNLKASFGDGAVRLEDAEAVPFRAAADGKFRTPVFEASGNSATLLVDGFLPRDISWTAGRGSHDLGEILMDQGCFLDVRVTRRTGEPLAGVALVLGVEGKPPASSGTTDASGNATLSGLMAESYLLEATLTGYAPGMRKWVPATGASRQTCDIVLERAASFICLLEQEFSVMPLGGIEVRYELSPESSGMLSDIGGLRARTDADGRLEIAVPKLGIPLQFELSVPGFKKHEMELAKFEGGEARDLGLITLTPGPGISGRVVDDKGRPVAEAQVALAWKRSGPEPGQSMQGSEGSSADASGHFTFGGLQPGEYTLVAEKSNYASSTPQEIELVEDGPPLDELVLVLEAGRVYRGAVLDFDGKPALDATVVVYRRDEPLVSNARAGVSADGSFEFRGAPSGPVNLRVEKRGVHHPIVVEESAASVERLPKKIVLPASDRIEVIVKTSGAGPLPKLLHYEIKTTGEDGGVTSSAGSFELRSGRGVLAGVAPGTHTLEIKAEGFAAPPPQTVNVEAGRTITVRVELDGAGK